MADETLIYICHKCKKELKDTVHFCEKCKLAFHPGCGRFHKVKNARGETIDCQAGFKIINLKNREMEMDIMEQHDRAQIESISESGEREQTTTLVENNSSGGKRRRLEDDTSDEEKLRQLIKDSMRNEVHPLIKKIDALQYEIAESRKEIIELKQVIVNLTSGKVKVNAGNLEQNDNTNNNNRSYASVLQKKKSNAVIVIKPVNSEQVNVDKDDNKNKKQKENLSNVKNNINIKDLGVGVTSVKEKKNGTVIVKCKNVNDRDKLQKNCVEKIGDNFQVQVPKIKKKFVKIIWIHNEEKSLTDEELINSIVNQNNLNEHLAKIEMKIVKRIVQEKKKEFSIIVETSQEVQQLLLFLEKICLGWKQCKILEHVNLVRCFKCCGFNHYAKDCKSKETCCKCGGAHNSKQCNSDEFKCVNCFIKMNKLKDKSNFDAESIKHNAYDKKCPIYLSLLNKQKERVTDNA